MERRDVKFGVLSYNCAGPKSSWATESKGGAALAIRPGMERDDWARQRREHFGFEPDPETPHLPYIQHITEQARLNARYRWEGDEVIIELNAA